MIRRPTAQQLSLLQGFERTAFAIADQVNRSPVLKRIAHTYLKTFGASWVYHFSKNILRVYELENLTSLQPDRGVLLACNHRSFFDMYTISSVILRKTDWVKGMYFPVRSDYFYERPDGVFVNAVMSAMAMYPPVMRNTEKRPFNQYAVDFVADVVQQPGSLVGFHPEGTRNKTDDPYTLLPANPGVGQIVYQAKPIVVPVFILGLTNNLPKQMMGNFDGTGEPITVLFGKPLDLERFYSEPAKLRTYKRLADHMRDEIMVLGEREREYRRLDGLPSLDAPAGSTTARDAKKRVIPAVESSALSAASTTDH